MSNRTGGVSRRGFLIASATSSAPVLLKGLRPLLASPPPSKSIGPRGSVIVSRPRINLDGAWDFQLDPSDRGIDLGWNRPSARFDRTLQVPGAWEAQGLGLPGGKVLEERTYEGVAWLRRSISIPSQWEGKQIWLSVGGVHRRATFWLNGKEVGSHDGYLTPFSFDITEYASVGAENTITARVDNIYHGPDDDQWGCFDWIYNWGGIHRSVYLEATEPVWIDDIYLIPDLNGRQARVKLRLARKMARSSEYRVECVISAAIPPHQEAGRGRTTAAFAADSTSEELELPVSLSDVHPWSPDDPFLYRVQVSLFQGDRKLDERWERLGMREIGIDGRRILLNGSPFYLLGYGDECIFPATVSPSLDQEEYRRRLKTARSFGFNYVRHHTHVPVEEYLEIADELGMMLQVELTIMGSYSNDVTMGSEYRKNLLEAEWRRLILQNRNHPSIITYSMGNENYSIHPDVRAFIAKLYRIAKELDPSRLVLNQSGSTVSQDRFGNTDIIERSFNEGWESPEGEIQANLEQQSKNLTRPVTVHEMGYFGAFPDPKLIPRYESSKALPAFYASQLLAQANASMKNQLILNPYFGKYFSYFETLPVWAAHSAKLQLANMKLAFEETRKVSTVNGYFLWSLTDTSTLVHGLLDDFWNSKLATPEEFRKFNQESVLLLGSRERVAWTGQEMAVTILISHFHPKPIEDGRLEWAFTLDGKPLVSGSADRLQASVGKVGELASFRATLPQLPGAATLLLTVTLKSGSLELSNDWKFWVFPKNLLTGEHRDVAVQSQLTPVLRNYAFSSVSLDELGARTPALLITSALPAPVLAYLEKGGRVFLLSRGLFEELETEYRPCYINFNGNNSGTLIRKHPALEAFPHEGFCDLQFYRMLKSRDVDGAVSSGKTIILEDFPVTVDPIIRSIDRYQYMRDKGYLFEMNVGKGKLLVSTLNFFHKLEGDSAARADFFGPECLFLFDQLVRYALGEAFLPKPQISAAALAKLLPPSTKHAKLDDSLDCSYCAP